MKALHRHTDASVTDLLAHGRIPSQKVEQLEAYIQTTRQVAQEIFVGLCVHVAASQGSGYRVAQTPQQFFGDKELQEVAAFCVRQAKMLAGELHEWERDKVSEFVQHYAPRRRG